MMAFSHPQTVDGGMPHEFVASAGSQYTEDSGIWFGTLADQVSTREELD